MRRITALLLGAVASVPLMAPSQSKADMYVYSHHSKPIYVAMAYRNDGCTTRYAKIGWYYTAPYGSTKVLDGWVTVASGKYYYFYGEDGYGRNWSGPYYNSVSNNAFHKCWNDNTGMNRYVGFAEVYVPAFRYSYNVHFL
jgi:uncharacterized membrane protein